MVLAQRHRAGEAAQTDFTRTAELGVTIAGQVFLHLLCVFVLPYSNWQWATVCLSESMAALRRGVQRALFQLGRAPSSYHQRDNSTSATHRIPGGKGVVVEEGRRAFHEGEQLAPALVRGRGGLCQAPRAIAPGSYGRSVEVRRARTIR